MDRPLRGVISQRVSRSNRLYLQIDVESAEVGPYLDQLRSYVGEPAFLSCVERKYERDGQTFHLTIVSPDEAACVPPSKIWSLVGSEIEFFMLGLGRAECAGDEAYFVVAESKAVNETRYALGLPLKDLHVTLGFSKDDIHDVDKSRSAIVTWL